MESRVELFAAIRRDARVEDLSIRELADRHHVHRRTVRQALASAFPPLRKTPVRVSRRVGGTQTVIDGWLRDDLDAPKKQRHTARRVLARLVDEQAAADVSYSTVRDYVARRRPEIAAEAGRVLEQGFVPQTHEPGGEAEVDFADLWVILRGVKTKTFLFTLRLSYSGKSVHRAFATQGQEAFLEGHVAGVHRTGWHPDRQDPLRQPEGGRVEGVVRSRPGRIGPVDGVQVPLRVHSSRTRTRRLALTDHARDRRSAACNPPRMASSCSTLGQSSRPLGPVQVDRSTLFPKVRRRRFAGRHHDL